MSGANRPVEIRTINRAELRTLNLDRSFVFFCFCFFCYLHDQFSKCLCMPLIDSKLRNSYRRLRVKFKVQASRKLQRRAEHFHKCLAYRARDPRLHAWLVTWFLTSCRPAKLFCIASMEFSIEWRRIIHCYRTYVNLTETSYAVCVCRSHIIPKRSMRALL